MKISQAAKHFVIYQCIYCVLVILGFAIFQIEIDSIKWESFIDSFTVFFFFVYLPLGFFIEPLISGLVFQIIYKSTLKSILILTAIKAIVGIVVGLAGFLLPRIASDFGEFEDLLGDAYLLVTPGLIVALYFMIISLIVYAIQHFEGKFIEKIKNRANKL